MVAAGHYLLKRKKKGSPEDEFSILVFSFNVIEDYD
jgi:hypothetical protein